jgi:hypothetical protein
MNGLESVVPAKMSERPDRAVACEPKMYDSGIARRSIKVSVIEIGFSAMTGMGRS